MQDQNIAVILDQATFGPDQPDWQSILTLPFNWQCFEATSPEQTLERIKGATVVMSNKVVIDKSMLEQAKGVKYIGVLATGTNNIDLEAAAEKGIKVQNVEGYGTASVVQHTFMLMLNVAGNAQRYQLAVNQGDWCSSPMFCLMQHKMVELAGKHLVIVGYGELGRSVARLAEAFGMKVSIAARPGGKVGLDGDVHKQDLDVLLPDADFVSLHCLLSEQTHQMMNARRLGLMKPTAFLINTARGPLIDEHALAAALESREIAGAGLDVLSQEPPATDNPLLNLSNVNLMITPHNAWATLEARQRLINIAAQHLLKFVEGNETTP